MPDAKLTTAELMTRLDEVEGRIAELDTARPRAETPVAATRVLGKTQSLQDGMHRSGNAKPAKTKAKAHA
jgi:hypothetical protein